MTETFFDYKSTQPFGLHDRWINKIEINGDVVTLRFEDGIDKLEFPYPTYPGYIEFHGVDLDFCSVSVLSSYWRYGRFIAKKLPLTEFLEKYPSFRFEAVDELRGYNRIQLGGYVHLPHSRTMKEAEIYMYFSKGQKYFTDEEHGTCMEC